MDIILEHRRALVPLSRYAVVPISFLCIFTKIIIHED
jgi:hypothetical protein